MMRIAAALCALAFAWVGHARAEPLSAADEVAAMGRGVNIIGYDPLWNDPAQARFKPRLMGVIRDGGFQTVRINLHAFRHMDASNQLAPQFLDTLDTMVGAALTQGLYVILDEHDYGRCGEDVNECRVKVLAFWEQIAARYKNAPESVMFELLNEPNRALDAHWNDLLAEALAVVRRTNPTRNVIIGPTSWNSRSTLDQLVLPEADRHIIVTFHYYEPMRFTHQGARWTPDFVNLSNVNWGRASELATLNADFDGVAAWARAHDRPILLGEFGAYDHGPMASRVAYTAAVARAAEARGFAWTYWQFDSDFIVYDIPNDRWVDAIHDALVPKGE